MITVPTSVRVPGFVPSVNGLRFANDFPSEALVTVDLPMVGTVPIGDASNGLCGGMVFAARDVFQTAGLAPIAAATHPKPGDPLFRYIVERLVASFDVGGLGVLKYFKWMTTPDGDSGFPPFLVRRGIAWKTIVEEWPRRIRPELDAGRLCCLGLVTVASADPHLLGQNHQVMAYGYELDAAANLRLLVYDPNTPVGSANEASISLSVANPRHPTPITSNIRIAHRIRGFFRVDYDYRNPTGHVG